MMLSWSLVEYAGSLIWEFNEGGFDCAGLICGMQIGLHFIVNADLYKKWDMYVFGFEYEYTDLWIAKWKWIFMHLWMQIFRHAGEFWCGVWFFFDEGK
jgi:hypothetical protein